MVKLISIVGAAKTNVLLNLYDFIWHALRIREALAQLGVTLRAHEVNYFTHWGISSSSITNDVVDCHSRSCTSWSLRLHQFVLLL